MRLVDDMRTKAASLEARADLYKFAGDRDAARPLAEAAAALRHAAVKLEAVTAAEKT